MIAWVIAALQATPIAITCPPAASVSQRPAAVCVDRDALILTPRIRFAPSVRALDPDSRPVIDALARLLVTHRVQSVAIHTHARRPSLYGQSRTAMQARVLREALVERGVPGAAIATRSFGDEQPLVSRHDSTAPWVNTRVEFWLVGLDRLRVR